MKFILIQGGPATGKTTLAKKVAGDLGCHLFSKDGFKETRFNELGRIPTVKEWIEIEIEARKKLYDVISSREHRTQFIVESNFLKKDKIAIQQLLKESDQVYEIFCYAKGFTPIRRYYARHKQGSWHKGHRANSIGYPIVLWLNLLSLIGFPMHKPLKLSEHVLKIDTTDFSKVDYKEILEFAKS